MESNGASTGNPGSGASPATSNGAPAGNPGSADAPVTGRTRLGRIFSAVVARRWLVVAFYAALLVPSAWLALSVGQDNSIDRLIVATDPDYIATREFEKVFGGGEFALLLAEADDPLAPGVVERVDRIERRLMTLPHVSVNSVLSVYRKARAGFEPGAEQIAALRSFATGTELFRRQGLLGDHYLAIGLILDVHTTEQRQAVLQQIDAAVADVDSNPGPIRALTRLGQPYVNLYLDQTQRGAWRYFVLFTAFVIVLNVALYRSKRTLLAFLITLAMCLAVSVGYIGLVGGMLTIVSPMVPMTILVTATATLVYIQSRFVECPAGTPPAQHQIFALENKFVACTASIFATAVGFAALMVSDIRPIRQMGEWVAVGLAMTWVIVFTLFPALQSILKTPTQRERPMSAQWFLGFAAWLPRLTYRLRWPFVTASLALCAIGAVALFGIPGVVSPMRILTDPVSYMSPSSPLYLDIRRLQPSIPGLSISQIWLRGELGSMSEPEVLSGINAFQQSLEADPEVGSVVGPTTILRLIRYLSGNGDAWPADPGALDQMAADLEGMVGADPMLARFVQPHSLAQSQVTVVTRTAEHEGFVHLDETARRLWQQTVQSHPALAGVQMSIVGLAPLHAKMAQNLVPTLVESFALTVVVIFTAFLFVFRSGSARLMAMIPSLFAILVMFLVMRLAGMTLNIATILIASTVLGTSENDQIHFFYHFLERRRDGTVEESLQHTLLIAGRAIFFATLINAGGFLAFAAAELPPVREFGLLSALAFVLSMIADFTALPAALWILLREKPDRQTSSSS